ncbi:MAG: PASTA domain-containing protein [Rikenellaceae bacterium]
MDSNNNENTQKNTQKKGKVVATETTKLIKHAVLIMVLIALGAGVAHFGLVFFTRHDARCTVPQLKGLIFTEAEYVAKDMDLNIVINDSLYAPMYEGGMVLDQLPKAGVDVKPGRTVYVTINAFGKKKVQVPYVAGRSLRQAKNMLEVAGLQIERLVYKYDMATNYVLAEYLDNTQISATTDVEAVVGSGVTLHVGMSRTDWKTAMPLLTGMTLSQAKSKLWESGLNVGKVTLPDGVSEYTKDRAKVYRQSVYQGADVTYGTNIAISLTFDEEVVAKEIAANERVARAAQKAAEEALKAKEAKEEF